MTLTEMLVVISIVILLLAIMVTALASFTHTSRVDSAADTLASAFREARYYAMSHNVPTVPVIVRDRKGHFTIMYAARALNFRGQMRVTQNPPISYVATSTTASGWTMYRQSVDLPLLQKGAFVYMVGTATMDLNKINPSGTNYDRYFEMLYLKVTPPADVRLINDSSQYRYDVLMRGVHNTAMGDFYGYYNSGLGADGFVVVSGAQSEETVSQANARDYTLTGYTLPEHVFVDQVTKADDPGTIGEGPVFATVTAQAAIFQEGGMFLPNGGKYEPSRNYPVFLPIFQPDGRVSSTSTSTGTLDDARGFPNVKYRDQTLRIIDKVTREARYVTIRTGNGQTVVSNKLPDGYGTPGD
ncbi:MAG: hypothetical protein KIS92_16905, partial [Planctomycetota bacterium]|nr:hypothetical protein [Planctomycetota bacterium]